jgi:uncharacterized membrane protein
MNGGRDPASGNTQWWDGSLAASDDPVVGAVALLVLGAGLGSLFGLPVLNAIDFWVIFAIGYAVVVPLSALLRGRGTDSADRTRESSAGARETSDDIDAALDRLRDRYASGELSEAEFERKLEALLETETPEDARERLGRRTDTDGTEGVEREPDRERSG